MYRILLATIVLPVRLSQISLLGNLECTIKRFRSFLFHLSALIVPADFSFYVLRIRHSVVAMKTISLVKRRCWRQSHRFESLACSRMLGTVSINY